MELPILHRWVPRPNGLGSYTALTLTGCYVCGRMFRFYEDRIKVKTPILLVMLLILLGIDTAGYGWLGHYASPFAIATAMVVFVLFKRIPVNKGVGRFVLLISPSMFSVYLLQGYRCRFDLMAWFLDRLSFLSRPLAYVCVGVIIFTICLLADVPRRMIWRRWR